MYVYLAHANVVVAILMLWSLYIYLKHPTKLIYTEIKNPTGMSNLKYYISAFKAQKAFLICNLLCKLFKLIAQQPAVKLIRTSK